MITGGGAIPWVFFGLEVEAGDNLLSCANVSIKFGCGCFWVRCWIMSRVLSLGSAGHDLLCYFSFGALVDFGAFLVWTEAFLRGFAHRQRWFTDGWTGASFIFCHSCASYLYFLGYLMTTGCNTTTATAAHDDGFFFLFF